VLEFEVIRVELQAEFKVHHSQRTTDAGVSPEEEFNIVDRFDCSCLAGLAPSIAGFWNWQ